MNSKIQQIIIHQIIPATNWVAEYDGGNIEDLICFALVEVDGVYLVRPIEWLDRTEGIGFSDDCDDLRCVRKIDSAIQTKTWDYAHGEKCTG